MVFCEQIEAHSSCTKPNTSHQFLSRTNPEFSAPLLNLSNLLQREQSEHALAFKTQEKYTLFVPGQNYLLLWLSEKDKSYFSSEQLEKGKKILASGLKTLICISRLRVRSFYYAMQFPLFLSTDSILILYNILKSVLSINLLFFPLKIGAIGDSRVQVSNLYWRTCSLLYTINKNQWFPQMPNNRHWTVQDNHTCFNHGEPLESACLTWRLLKNV